MDNVNFFRVKSMFESHLRGSMLTVQQAKELAEILMLSVDPISMVDEQNKASYRDFESRKKNVESSAVIGIQRKLPSTG